MNEWTSLTSVSARCHGLYGQVCWQCGNHYSAPTWKTKSKYNLANHWNHEFLLLWQTHADVLAIHFSDIEPYIIVKNKGDIRPDSLLTNVRGPFGTNSIMVIRNCDWVICHKIQPITSFAQFIVAIFLHWLVFKSGSSLRRLHSRFCALFDLFSAN